MGADNMQGVLTHYGMYRAQGLCANLTELKIFFNALMVPPYT